MIGVATDAAGGGNSDAVWPPPWLPAIVVEWVETAAQYFPSFAALGGLVLLSSLVAYRGVMRAALLNQSRADDRAHRRNSLDEDLAKARIRADENLAFTEYERSWERVWALRKDEDHRSLAPLRSAAYGTFMRVWQETFREIVAVRITRPRPREDLLHPVEDALVQLRLVGSDEAYEAAIEAVRTLGNYYDGTGVDTHEVTSACDRFIEQAREDLPGG